MTKQSLVMFKALNLKHEIYVICSASQFFSLSSQRPFKYTKLGKVACLPVK